MRAKMRARKVRKKKTNSNRPKYFVEKPADPSRRWWPPTDKALRCVARPTELAHRAAPDAVPVSSARAAEPDRVRQLAPVLLDLAPERALHQLVVLVPAKVSRLIASNRITSSVIYSNIFVVTQVHLARRLPRRRKVPKTRTWPMVLSAKSTS